jgi:hypothetical protein
MTNVLDANPDIAEKLMSELLTYTANTNVGNHILVYPTDETGGGNFTISIQSESGLFHDVSDSGSFTLNNKTIEDHLIEFKIAMEPAGDTGGYIGIDFYLDPEDADVSFTVTYDDDPSIEFPWHIGSAAEPVISSEYVISMNNPSIVMSFPQVRHFRGRGVYIWSVPPSLKSEFESRLSPEEIAELEALGYVH